MNSKNVREYLPLVQALADGKKVEFRDYDGVWCSAFEINFNQRPETYRIKPESTIRPFNADELRQLWLDGVKLVGKGDGIGRIIHTYDKSTITVAGIGRCTASCLLSGFEIPPQQARPNGGICGVGE